MKPNAIVAGALSLLIPGLGQIYAGEGNRGAAILVAATIIRWGACATWGSERRLSSAAYLCDGRRSPDRAAHFASVRRPWRSM